jgi:hypothetical protein
MTGDHFMANIVDADNVQARIAEIIKLCPVARFMKGSASNLTAKMWAEAQA